MSQTDKLLRKLQKGTITGPELETLLGKLGWKLLRTTGSHMVWGCEGRRLTLIANRRKLLPYQVKEAKKVLNYENEENG